MSAGMGLALDQLDHIREELITVNGLLERIAIAIESAAKPTRVTINQHPGPFDPVILRQAAERAATKI